jgi:hypothetical protein
MAGATLEPRRLLTDHSMRRVLLPRWITIALACAGPLSVILAPLSAALAVTCAGLGLVAGMLGLVWPDEMLARLLAAGAVAAAILWAPEAAHALRPQLEWPWWQPALLTISAQAMLALLARAVRQRFRRAAAR